MLSRVIFATFLCLSVLIVYMSLDAIDSIAFLATNVLIVAICIACLTYRSDMPFSMHNVFYIFALFFFGITPALELSESVVYWGGAPIDTAIYVYGNVTVLCCLIIYQIGYVIKFGYHSVIPAEVIFRFFSARERRESQDFLLLLLVSFASSLVIAWYNNFDILAMLVRGGDFIERVTLAGPIDLIYSNALRPMPVICFIFYAMFYGLRGWRALILLILALFFASPTSMPRFQAAVLYITLLLVVSRGYRRDYMFPMSIFAGLLWVMPLLERFRFYERGQELRLGFDYDFLLEGHFDSYQNFVRLLELDIITYGRQLLGVFLFFVPRSVWPNKPVGSGHYFADQAGLSFPNISMNFLGEGYINFGFPGAFGFVFILAMLCGWGDRFFWKSSSRKLDSNLPYVVYLLMLGSVFFMMRGDLLSSFSYLVGVSVSAVLVHGAFNRLPAALRHYREAV